MRIAVLAVLGCGLGFAQGVDPALTFEVASVKPSAPAPEQRFVSTIVGGPSTGDPGQFTYTNATLKSLLLMAYKVKDYQVTAPAWLDSERYDVVAKVPPGASKEQFNRMLQNLLAERFHLALHRDSKEVNGYDLVVGKNGSKLKAAGDPDAPVVDGPAFAPGERPKIDKDGFPQLDRPALVTMVSLRNGILDAKAVAKEQPLSKLTDMLGNELRAPVIDKTGLAGRYDFTLEFAPDPANLPGLPPPPPGAAAALETSPAPTIQAAIQEQLGLRLEQKKIPVEMLIIDRVDKTPTEN